LLTGCASSSWYENPQPQGVPVRFRPGAPLIHTQTVDQEKSIILIATVRSGAHASKQNTLGFTQSPATLICRAKPRVSATTASLITDADTFGHL